MRSKFVCLAALFLYTAAPAYADDQSRLREARKVVQLSHSADQVRALLPLMDQQLRPVLLGESGNNAKAVDQFMAKMDQRISQNVDSFVDLAAQVYAREFTDDDLDALIAFYQSPAGQHLVDKQVVIASGMMAVGQQWGAQIAQDILKEFKQEQSNPASKL